MQQEVEEGDTIQKGNKGSNMLESMKPTNCSRTFRVSRETKINIPAIMDKGTHGDFYDATSSDGRGAMSST